ncbi:hypothetical protein VCHA28FP16_270033 [Vibrio chagasii]|nr:hypothetical protein VCHA28FP16_270033 [Vibrio chagasii]
MLMNGHFGYEKQQSSLGLAMAVLAFVLALSYMWLFFGIFNLTLQVQVS